MGREGHRQTFVRKILWALRLRGEAAADPTAQALHVLMLLLLALTGTQVTIGAINHHDHALILLLGIPITLSPVMTLVLLRRNRIRAAGVVYLVGMWIGFTAIIVLNGGIRHVGLAVYIALAVSAAWLFGYGAALWMAAACVGCMLVVAVLENEGRGPPRLLPGTPMGIWMLMIESTLMGVMPVSLILSSYKQALARSQRAEAELKAHQQSLEELVRQRTVELVEARDQAEAANRAKSAFLANMSHELRTPLNAVLGFTTLVREDPGLPARHRKDLEIVTRSGEHLLNLIDDVLDIAKIEAGRLVLELAAVQLHDLLRVSVELMRRRAEEKGLILAFERSDAVPRMVRCDGGKLRQVLVNLIGNAVKYTSEGRVVVSADANRTADGLSLVVEVSDTGVGLAPEDQGRVFDPFVQAGHRSSQKGTGLGLAISRSCMEVMGGSLTVQSKLGSGSVFRIELPVDEVEEPALAVHEFESRRILSLLPGQPDYRILIVEDQPENWMVLERMLQSVGLAVRVAQDGKRAIEEFRSWRPHFIWMDLGLPGIDGKEAARRIRDCEGGRDVKIVAVTASVFATQRDEVLAAGIDGFLRKPYRPQEIFERMADLLGVRYSYAKEARHDGWGGSLDPDRIRAIPQDLREELIAALLRLEPGPIKAVISNISAYDESIAVVLAGFADRYSYSSILAALHAAPDGPAQKDS